MYMKQNLGNVLASIIEPAVMQRTVRGAQVMRKEVRNNGRR